MKSHHYIALPILAITLAGCAANQPTPQVVKVPVRCLDKLPPKPVVTGNNRKDTIELQKSYLILRRAVQPCTRAGARGR